MHKRVVVFLNGRRHDAIDVDCEGHPPTPPTLEEFEDEARRAMIASGSLTADDGLRAKFVVQD